MSTSGEKLQDAIGLISDEYVLEATGEPAATEPAELGAAAMAVRGGRQAEVAGASEGMQEEGDIKAQGEGGAGASADSSVAASEGVFAQAGSAQAGGAQAGSAQVGAAGAQASDDSASDDSASGGSAGGVRAAAGGAQSDRQERPAARKAPVRMRVLAACLVLLAGIGAIGLAYSALGPTASLPETALESTSGDASATSSTSDEKADSRDVAEAARSDAFEPMAVAEEDGALGAVEGYGAIAAEVGPPSVTIGPGTPSIDLNAEPGEAFVLTAAEWNDNANWPFFTNLVNGGTITFPVFGLDPTHRVKATVVDEAGNPLRGQAVVLADDGGNVLWTARSDKDGAAYLFYRDGEQPAFVGAGGVSAALSQAAVPDDDPQGKPVMRTSDEVTLTLPATASADPAALQVMFIVDTTGSMSDEIAYLQKDFASIAAETGGDGMTYSVNFYRDQEDEYVTKCNGFTDDVATVQRLLNDEYADGGGDAPEAVAQILSETITGNGAWRDDCSKVAFLIFDAPPHEGTDAELEAAVRSAAERGIRLVPVVASNADRETELFGRALAILTDGTYVFLTDDSGVGDSHLEPIVGDYTVEKLHDVIVRIINESR